MADFGITYPDEDSAKVTLVRRKGNTNQQFFAIGGFGKGLTNKPHQAVLVADGADPDKQENHLFYGHLFREPGQDAKKDWALWFNLEDLDLGTNKYDLYIYRVDRVGKKKDKLGFRRHLTFNLKEFDRNDPTRGVQVIYPDGAGPYCQDGFTPYGIFTNPDTRILRVDLVTVDGGATNVESTDSSPTFTREGFWCSSFSGLDATKKYRARAVGDVNVSALSPEFTVQSC
jgi:hypothetical protein